MRERDARILHLILETRGRFGHREHLELVWSHLRLYDAERAHEATASAIRQVARSHGAPDKYHETITRFWVHLVAVHANGNRAESFDQFLTENQGLLDRHLLDRHYSRELITSRQARDGWTPPDLRELPRAA